MVKRKKRGRPPVHGAYCRVKPTLEDTLDCDRFAAAPFLIPSEREVALTLLRERNSYNQKLRRERKIKKLIAEGKYRGPGRPQGRFGN